MVFDLTSPYWERLNAEKDDENVNWKQMYLHLAGAVAQATDILIKAQQECEDMYIERE